MNKTLVTIMLSWICVTDIVSATDKAVDNDILYEECELEMTAAASATRLRNQGKPRQELAAALSPIKTDSSRLLIQLHAILNEVYTYQDLDDVIYSLYRLERCQREKNEKPVPDSISVVHEQLLNCQEDYNNDQYYDEKLCVRAAFDTKLY